MPLVYRCIFYALFQKGEDVALFCATVLYDLRQGGIWLKTGYGVSNVYHPYRVAILPNRMKS